MSGSSLFRSFDGGGLRTANRIVMAPMTRRHSPDGVPTEAVAAYYQRRAAADVGLIITEGVSIDHPTGSNSSNVPHMHGEEALAGWERIVRDVHAVGSRIVSQLWHVGARAVDPSNDQRPLEIASPSGIWPPDESVGEPMPQAMIDAVIDSYAAAAKAAQHIGFDGVEFHAAHGYLIDQFFWPLTNRRQDGYGGNLRSRTRFAAEIVRESRRRVGPHFPLLMRISQFKYLHYDYKLAVDPQALSDLVEPLVEAGLSIFHCSQRRFWQPEFPDSDLNLAGWTKKLSGLPVITVGSVGLDRDIMSTNYLEKGISAAPAALDRLEAMVDRNEVDLVAVGRALLQDPLWAQKVRLGKLDDLKSYDIDALTRLY
jgi:2,4-dienoyl-CoA reductase-like NADH-dependent reductase (Old Yellow Enzyme family)